MRARSLLVVVILASGCAGPPTVNGPTPYLDVWGSFEDEWAKAAQLSIDCQDDFDAYNWDFGIRGLACIADRGVSLETMVSRAPVAPFESGPHTATAEAVDLELNSLDGFGHYDPAFVEWFVEAGIPGDSAPVRAVVQPVYDRYVARLARLYWLTAADLEGRGFPDALVVGPFSDYQTYLETGDVPTEMESWHGGYSVFAFTEMSEDLLPEIGLEIGNEWFGKYEGNTAYGFWMRREQDGTRELWHDGLRDLLARYDGAWLASRS